RPAGTLTGLAHRASEALRGLGRRALGRFRGDRGGAGGGRGGGGPVALGGRFDDGQRAEVAAALSDQHGRLTPLEELPHRMPRGPPGVRVMVAGGDVSLPYADRLVAFGWRDPEVPLASYGVVVLTMAMLDEIAGHLAAGRLPDDFWRRLLEHERDFHLGEHPEHTGARHDLDAAALAEELLLARGRAGMPIERDLLDLLRVVEAALLEHPVLAVLGVEPLPVGAHSDRPLGLYGDYFANPDFRASEADRRAYLANPPVSARQDAAISRAIDALGGITHRIPRADLHAILVYLSALYAEPNAALRSGDRTAIARYETFIRVAASGFNQLVAGEDITSYRGIQLSAEDIALLPRTHPVGALVVDAGFGSTEVPDRTGPGEDPSAGLRTTYYGESSVTIEVRSRTGRDSWPLMRAITGSRFHELTFLPGSVFVVRELSVTRDLSGRPHAHMVWEDVSHLRPPRGSLRQLHTDLLGALTELRGHAARAPGAPRSAVPGLLDLTHRLLDNHFTSAGPATGTTSNCTNCGEPPTEGEQFCEACGTPTAANGGAGGSADGGAVAIGGLPTRQRLTLLRALPLLAPYLRPLEELTDRMPRGPPPVLVLDLDHDQVRAVLAGAGFTDAGIAQALDALNRLVMFGWRDPAVATAAGGVVVITRAMLDELLGHLGAGRITPAAVNTWWTELLGHEVRFHLAEHPNTDHADHARDEVRLAAPLLRARAIAAAAGELGLTDPAEVGAIGRAYDVAFGFSAPFVVRVARGMLADLRADVAADPAGLVVFVGRDGASFASAVAALDPGLFAAHGRQVVLPRAVVAAAVADVRARTGRTFPELAGFLGPAGRVRPEDVPGAFDRLNDYLSAAGIPVHTPGLRITLIDSSYTGSIQIMLQALYPHVSFQGRYAFFGQSARDPHPGTKRGYALHRDGDRLTADFPVDPALTWAHAQAIGVFEDLHNGPWSSPTRVDALGPTHTALRDERTPLAGLNRARIAPAYTDPRVREAVKRIVLAAVADYAGHIAALADHGVPVAPILDQGAARYTHQVRGWITGEHPDPAFAELADAFVYRGDQADRALIDQLATALDHLGVTGDLARHLWSRFDRTPTRDARQALIEEVRGAGEGVFGVVAIGGLSERERQLLARALPLLAPYLRPLEQLTERMPTGPPAVLVVDLRWANAVLAEAAWSEADLVTAADVLRRLVMAGWRAPAGQLLAEPVAVLTDSMLDELLAHLADGRLTRADLEALWAGLLAGPRSETNAETNVGTNAGTNAEVLADVVSAARAREELSRARTYLARARGQLVYRVTDGVADFLADAGLALRRAELPPAPTGPVPAWADAVLGRARQELVALGRELAWLEQVFTVMDHQPLDDEPTAAFWTDLVALLPVLIGGAHAGDSLRAELLRLGVDAIGVPFARGGDYRFLAESEIVAGYRTGPKVRDKLAFALLLA
ncbi:MAG: hypothetical protein QOF99_8807, partial [Pseudonocardiales bacterium]|nr:hypothetical protein [Pseudonocardiales bacterium]